MKAKDYHLFLSLLLLMTSSLAGKAQGVHSSDHPVCIDCSVDSVHHLLISAVTGADSLYAIVASLDNLDNEIRLNTFSKHVSELVRLNFRLNLIDTTPYILIRDGLKLWDQKDDLGCIEKFKESITVFDGEKKIMSTFSILNVLRIYFNFAGLQEEKLKYFQEKLKYYQENGPPENTAVCYHATAGYYYYKADYNSAINNYLKAAEIFKQFSTPGYNNEIAVVGMLYFNWGNFTRAKFYLQKGYESAGRDSAILTLTLRMLALIEKSNHNYEVALDYIERSVSYGAYSANMRTINLGEKGGILLEMNKPEEAYQILTLAEHIRDSLALPILTVNGNFEGEYYLYKYYYGLGDFANAEKKLLSAYDNATKGKENGLMLNYRKELAFFYSHTGNAEKATRYAINYITFSDSLRHFQNENNVSEYEKLQQEKQSEEQVRGLENQKKQQRNYSIIGGFFLLLLSVGIFSRLQYMRKVNKQIGEKNKQIEKEKYRAEQGEIFKQQFLANMSHEIRTPMNAMMGMTNLVLDSPLNDKQKFYVEGIRNSSEALLHIINDILDLSKIEAGKMELEKIDFSIYELLENIKMLLRHKADEKEIELNSFIEPGIPEILIGDPGRLNQVLINLAGNAIKFTERGSVTIEISKGSGDGEIRFSIIDTGIGIPQDKMQNVFENFSQAHSSDSRKFGGTGLGLSISKQLVELMGGKIQLESVEGVGTTFSFQLYFPVGSKEGLNKQKSPDQIDGRILNGLNILVVDDIEYNRIVIHDTLISKADVVITMATNGREAVDLIARNDFDVVLMDIQMPVMDGFEATSYIREKMDPPKNQIPIIAVTASVVRSDLDKCRAAGMNDFIPKPFRVMDLLSAVARTTGQKSGTKKMKNILRLILE